MNNIKPFTSFRTSIYLFFYLTLTGFSFGQFIDDIKYKGTNVGVMNCVKENTPDDAGMDKKKIKELCVKKHEKNLKLDLPVEMTGRYSYGHFKVELENKSKDIIITMFDVFVRHDDNKDKIGKQISEIIKFQNIWIPPGEKKKVSSSKLKFFPSENRHNSTDKDGKTKWFFSFGVNSYKGVKVVLK
jgi:hypothetical protein